MTGTTLGSAEHGLTVTRHTLQEPHPSTTEELPIIDPVIDPQAELTSRLSGARILVTTMYYAPETTGSAPYTTDLAEHLAGCGARVRVVTMHPHYPQWLRPEGVLNGPSVEQLAGVEVVRVRGYVPRNPTLLKRALYEAVYTARAWRQTRAFVPDVVIACTPSLFAGALGAMVAERRGVPCMTVVQDLITSAAAQSGLGGAGRAKALLSAIERWTFRHSALVTVPSAAFAPVVAQLAPQAPVSVVPNWSRLATQSPVTLADAEASEKAGRAMRSRLGWEGRFVVAHTGNMGLKQGLEDLARALHHLSVVHPEMLVSFIGDGSRRTALERATAGLSSAEVRDPVSSDDYPLLLRAADALLVHERSTVRDMSLPSKLTSYFTAGRPVVAMVRRDSATAAELERSGAGVVVDRDDPSALANKLELLRSTPDERDRLAAAGVTYAGDVLRPAAALGRLARLISDLLPGGTDARKGNA